MKMQKHLSDSEMMSWNDRLDGTPYFVIPRYHSHNSFPMIVFKQRMTKGLGSFKTDPTGEVITLDPHMKFSFSFSVAKNRVDNFFHIFNKWFSNKIETKTIYQDSSNNEKISDIKKLLNIIKTRFNTKKATYLTETQPSLQRNISQTCELETGKRYLIPRMGDTGEVDFDIFTKGDESE